MSTFVQKKIYGIDPWEVNLIGVNFLPLFCKLDHLINESIMCRIVMKISSLHKKRG